MLIRLLVVACILFLTTGAYGTAEITGGSDIVGNGNVVVSGERQLYCDSGDPSITLGITSTSSVFGKGSFNDQKTGNQSIILPLSGFVLSAGYNGTVSSSMTLTSGSAMTQGFIKVTATGISTGLGSYDLFGSADILTEGYMYGAGTGEAHASGLAYYSASKSGTPSQAWGSVEGTSGLSIHGLSSSSLVGTGGSTNGLHADSRMQQTIDKVIISSSNSRLNSYASSIGRGLVNASSSGIAECGAWSPSFVGEKAYGINENATSFSSGFLGAYSESNGAGDSADASAILQSLADIDSMNFTISGGPACYSSSTQTSRSSRTYAEARIQSAIWNSVLRPGAGIRLSQNGTLSDLASNASVSNANSSAMTFGRILLNTDYTIIGKLARSAGNMSLETYAEATEKSNARAGTKIGPTGNGTVTSSDSVMINTAHFSGGLNHSSSVDAPLFRAETHNVLGSGYVSTTPYGHISVIRPFNVTTASNPYVAWSRTVGIYDQSH
jgi:hypothetical protein